VLPCELPIVAQAQPGAVLRFRLIGLDEADRLTLPDAATLQALRARVRPLRRDPAGIGDLLGYQLISGVTRGDDLEGG
jgi:allophanate hydrolase